MEARGYLTIVSAAATLAMLTTSCTPSDEGALVGGAIGSVAGGAITDSGTGALVGGLVGAAVGAAIADDRSYRRPYYGRNRYSRGYRPGNYYHPGSNYRSPYSRGYYRAPYGRGGFGPCY